MDQISLLVVDDHPLVRRGLISMLSSCQDMIVVGEAGDGSTALHMARKLRPDVILLDIRMPGQDGTEVARQLRYYLPSTKVVILTAYEEDEFVFEALRAGAHAYVLKKAADKELVDVVREASRGGRALSRSLIPSVMQQFEGLAVVEARRRIGLGDEEIEVLRLLIDGATNREICDRLYCSERTVKRIIGRIARKLDVDNRLSVATEAIRRGLV